MRLDDPTASLASRELGADLSRHCAAGRESTVARAVPPGALLDQVSASLGIPVGQISPGASLTRDLGLDRWDLLELIEDLEAEWLIALSASAVEGLRCVSDLLEAVAAAETRRPEVG